MKKGTILKSVLNTTFLVSLSFYFMPFLAFAQSEKEIKMKELAFMVGDWVGTSTTYEGGEIKEQVPAYQKISYDLDSNIIVIALPKDNERSLDSALPKSYQIRWQRLWKTGIELI